MKAAFRLVLILLFFASPGYAQWDTDAWSGDYVRYYLDPSTNPVYIKEVFQTNTIAALSERTNVITVTTNYEPPSGWYRSNRAHLIEAKDWIKANCTNFVDIAQTNALGNFDTYFASNPGETNFPVFSYTGLCASVSAPTNYLDSTPYRKLTDPATPNGWHYLDEIIDQLVWVQKIATLETATESTGNYDFPDDVDSDASALEGQTITYLYDGPNCEWDEQTPTGTAETTPTYPAFRSVKDDALFTGYSTNSPATGSTSVLTSEAVGTKLLEAFGDKDRYYRYFTELEHTYDPSYPTCDECSNLSTNYIDTDTGYSSGSTFREEGTMSYTVTTGRYGYASNLYTGATVDVYTVLTPLTTNVSGTVTGSEGVFTNDGTWADAYIGLTSISAYPGCAILASFEDYVDPWDVDTANFSGTVDFHKGLTALTGWQTLAKEKEVTVPTTGTMPDYAALSPVVDPATLVTKLSGTHSASLVESWTDTDTGYIYCNDGVDTCLGTWKYEEIYTTTGLLELYHEAAMYAASSGSDHWGCTKESELMLVRYNVTDGFAFQAP